MDKGIILKNNIRNTDYLDAFHYLMFNIKGNRNRKIYEKQTTKVDLNRELIYKMTL